MRLGLAGTAPILVAGAGRAGQGRPRPHDGNLSQLLPVAPKNVVTTVKRCCMGGGSALHCTRGGEGRSVMAEDVNPSQKGPGAGFSLNTHNVVGGAIIAVLGFFLLFGTTCISSPTAPRALAILVAVAGIAVAVGIMPVRAERDLYGGLVLVALGCLALLASADLPGQRGFAFGPGTAPRLFAGLLAAIGVAVALTGLFFEGPNIEKYKVRGPALVIIGIVCFAALVRPFGIVTATYTAFIVSILGSTEMKWLESLVAAAIMTGLCVGLFVYLLNLPFQLWPQPNAHVILGNQFVDIFRNAALMFQKSSCI